LVTRARTGVDYDYKGNVIDAHAPEVPTRFAKQLQQVVRGAVAIGVPRGEALKLAIRCARDSMPPLRLSIIDDLAANSESSTSDIRKRINKLWSTVDRQLQAVHMLEVLGCDEVPYGDDKHRWLYSIAEDINPSALSPGMSVGAWREGVDEPPNRDASHFPYVGSDKSGEDSAGKTPATETLWPTCRTEGCTTGLYHPDSQRLVYCANCRKDDAP
jgi:hypothetical protein